jgi:hypothetical protein
LHNYDVFSIYYKNYHTGRRNVLAFDFDDLFVVDFDEFQFPLRRISTSTSTNFNFHFDEFVLDFSTSTNLDWNWYLDIWKWYLRNGNDMYMFVILSPLGNYIDLWTQLIRIYWINYDQTESTAQGRGYEFRSAISFSMKL